MSDENSVEGRKMCCYGPMTQKQFVRKGSGLTTYAGKKVTIGVGHFQIIDFFYDW